MVSTGIEDGNGGDNKGMPVETEAEFVVTEVVSVAVVEVCGDVVKCRLSSKLFMEEGGLLTSMLSSSERREGFAMGKEFESRLSVDGLPSGGGIERLALGVVAVTVSMCGDLLISSPLLTASKVCVLLLRRES